jgi:hypothetical protein
MATADERREVEDRRGRDRRHTSEDLDERVSALERSLERRTEILREVVSEAVKDAMVYPQLSADEHRWVQLAIKRESQAIEFRKAVIEKTLTSLIWAGVIGLGILVKEWLNSHGVKF